MGTIIRSTRCYLWVKIYVPLGVYLWVKFKTFSRIYKCNDIKHNNILLKTK